MTGTYTKSQLSKLLRNFSVDVKSLNKHRRAYFVDNNVIYCAKYHGPNLYVIYQLQKLGE